jgi:hypothetical protein
LELHDFLSRRENGIFIVWTESKSNFVELPPESFEVLLLLKKGLSLAEVLKVLKEKYGEQCDVLDFVSELIQNGFVKSIDGIRLPSETNRKVTFSFIKKKHVGWIYSKPLFFLYAILMLFALVILVLNPSYMPTYQDFFFSENYLVSILLSIVSVLVLVFVHELAHLVAGKSVGVNGYFSVGMRLFYPVAETNLTGLWSVPRKRRILPFLAGMLNDALIISLVLILFWLSDYGIIASSNFPFSFGKFLILILFYGIMWQFLFFVRTDVYFIFSTLTGARNLYGDSWHLIRNKVLSLIGRKTIPLALSPNELRVVKVYSLFMLAGTVFSVATFVYFGIPILIEIFGESISQMMIFGSADFIQGALLFALTSLQIGALLLFLAKSLWKLKR